MTVDYTMLAEQMKALAEDVTYTISNLANASALLFDSLSELNWAGFYLMMEGELVLGPFIGKPACTKIAVGRGVCGTAVKERRSIRVEDVHCFPGHIACDADSRSELVIPIFLDGDVWGVLDMDSPKLARFTEEDRKGLEYFVQILEGILQEK